MTDLKTAWPAPDVERTRVSFAPPPAVILVWLRHLHAAPVAAPRKTRRK